MPTLDKTIDHLNQLLVACHDGQLAYQDFALRADDAQLRHLFVDRAREWPKLSAQVSSQIREYGGRSVQRPSIGGTLQRGWEGLKSAFGAIDDHALLDEGLRVETVALRRFEALLREPLAPPFRQQLQGYYRQMLERQAQMRALLSQWPRMARR